METKANIKNYFYGMDSDEAMEMVLKERGIKDPDSFLNPSEEFIKPPETLPNIREAGSIVECALFNKKKVFLNVDSDTDGITSGTIIKRYIDHVWDVDIPWHVSEGKSHGTSQALTEKLEKEKPDILIIVDSLDGTVENYKKYAEMGIKVIILDHHDVNPEVNYSDYALLVSSNLSETPELSGAGVAWKFCKYLDYITLNNYADELVDLAAVGLVADMVDLSEASMDNRAICWKGFQNLKNPAIKKIIGSFPFNSQSVAFSIAPLINACCRYSHNDIAFKCFIADNVEFIKKRLKIMNHWKTRQAEEVSTIFEDLIPQIEAQKDEKVLAGFIETPNGITGLVANKILARYKKPVLIFRKSQKDDPSQTLTGSGRGLGQKNFKEACGETGLGKGFGHPHAFGVFTQKENFDEFMISLRKLYENETFTNEVSIDLGVNAEDITNNLVNTIKFMNTISGTGFPAIQVAVILKDYGASTMTQGKHLVLNDGYFTYIQWNVGEKEEYYQNLADKETPIMVSGTLDSGFFGRKFVPRMIINNIVEQREVL